MLPDNRPKSPPGGASAGRTCHLRSHAFSIPFLLFLRPLTTRPIPLYLSRIQPSVSGPSLLLGCKGGLPRPILTL